MVEIPAAADAADGELSSFAACLASVLELELEDVPLPRDGDPLMVWRQWLASRGWGLVSPAGPEAFGWAGHWIARLAAADGTRPAVVMFGSPSSGIVWDPLRRPGAADEPVAEAFVLAPLDPAAVVGVGVGAAGAAPLETQEGILRGVYVAAEARGPMVARPSAEALPGRGLRGDRYAAGAGTFSAPGSLGNELTLVEVEALALPDGTRLAPEDARRNLVTRGIRLDALIGRRFSVGEVECVGRRRCEPCAHLERLARPGVLRGLVHRGGLRADILSHGVVRIGDPVRVLGEPA